MLDSLFRLDQNGTTVRTEVIAGATTFLTMTYIPRLRHVLLVDSTASIIGSLLGTPTVTSYAAFPNSTGAMSQSMRRRPRSRSLCR